MTFKTLLATLIGAAILGGCCTACKQRVKNARPLEGTEWHLVQIGGRDVAYEADTFNITLEGGRLSGVGACNRLMGDYMLAPKSGLSFDNLASTRMMCPNMEDETAFCLILDGTTHYDIDYDTLMLMQDGVIKAVLKAVEKK